MSRRRRRALGLAATLAGGTAALVVAFAGSASQSQLPAGLAEKLEEEAEEVRARFDKPAEAQAFFVLKRSPDRKTPVAFARYRAAMEHWRGMPRYSTASGEVAPPETRSPLG